MTNQLLYQYILHRVRLLLRESLNIREGFIISPNDRLIQDLRCNPKSVGLFLCDCETEFGTKDIYTQRLVVVDDIVKYIKAEMLKP